MSDVKGLSRAHAPLVSRNLTHPPSPPGYDIVFVAGQSNAVGNSFTADAADAPNDAYGSLPIFYEQFGIDANCGGAYCGGYPGWDGTAANGVLPPPVGRKIPATGAGGLNDFVANFTKSYASSAYFTPGRAVLVVNAAFGASGFLPNNDGKTAASQYTYGYPAAGSTLLLLWAPVRVAIQSWEEMRQPS